jgi:hypothetical protein
MLHPLLMVTYGSLIYFFILPSEFQAFDNSVYYKILGLIFISTFVFPVFSGLVMKRFGYVSDMQMEKRKERNWPLLQTAVIYFVIYYIIHSKAIPAFIQLFLLGSIIGILFALVVNLRWKISLHMIGAGGLCGAISAIMLTLGIGSPLIPALCFTATGMLGTARLYLNCHTPAQILAGFLGGFGIEFGIIYFAFH